MKDNRGNELQVGQTVVFNRSGELQIGVIQKLIDSITELLPYHSWPHIIQRAIITIKVEGQRKPSKVRDPKNVMVIFEVSA